MKSALFGALFFIGLIVPALLMFGIDSLHQNAFAKVTKEITELVQEDAGVSDRVKSVVNDYKPKGYVITFKDQFGQAVNGIMNYGDTVYVNFKYTYKSVYKDRTIESTNKAFIAKRNGVNPPGWSGSGGNNGGNTDGGELKTFTAKTTLSGNSTQEQTFIIPNMKQLLRVTTNTGSVQVVKVDGNRVTIRASGGSVKERVQTGGSVKADETKIVTDKVVSTKSSEIPNSIPYNKDGFVGTLTKTGEMKTKQTGGELIPGETKVVGNQTSPNYSDSEGFKGTLERYVHSGTYTPPQNKFVTAQTSANYSDAEGYRGTLSQYVHSGSYTPKDTKWVTNQTSQNYNSGGYRGVLDRYKYGEITIPGQREYKYQRIKMYKGITNTNYGYTMKNVIPDTIAIKDYPVLYDEFKDFLMGIHNGQLSREHCTANLDPIFPCVDVDGYYEKKTNIRVQTNLKNVWGAHRFSSWVWNDLNNGIKTLEDLRNSLGYFESTSVIDREVLVDTGSGYPSLLYYDDGMGTTGFLKPDWHTIQKLVSHSSGGWQASSHYIVTEMGYVGYVTKPQTTRTEYRYQGYVTRPEEDTRIYRYQGTVTKPAVDTREYRYGGTVTKGGSDTRTYEYTQEYKGTVTKKGEDTRTYENRYQYDLLFEYR
ncbi:hypothetical protein [Siminovitchia terrae]|nr:hypothetical protein [Siminovitchia terrae]